MVTREELRRLIDELPENELHAALRFLEYLRDLGVDPFMQALMASPDDDEPETPEERSEAQEAWQQYLAGATHPWEEVREELPRE